jgi:hypothetical protein
MARSASALAFLAVLALAGARWGLRKRSVACTRFSRRCGARAGAFGSAAAAGARERARRCRRPTPLTAAAMPPHRPPAAHGAAAQSYPSFWSAMSSLPDNTVAIKIVQTLGLQGTLSNPKLALTVLMPQDAVRRRGRGRWWPGPWSGCRRAQMRAPGMRAAERRCTLGDPPFRPPCAPYS